MYKPVKRFMEAAIAEAKKSQALGDYGIGAAVVRKNQIVVVATNRARIDNDATAHAEMVAIRLASKKFKSRFLKDCVLYTTHEPCPMCTSAAIWARMDGIVAATRMQDMVNYKKSKGNNTWTWRTINIPAKDVLKKGEPKLFIINGFMRKEALKLFHS